MDDLQEQFARNPPDFMGFPPWSQDHALVFGKVRLAQAMLEISAALQNGIPMGQDLWLAGGRISSRIRGCGFAQQNYFD